MLLDIVILPPANLRNKLGKAITRVIKGLPTIYVVDNKKLIPHMSLFHIRTSKNGLKKLSKKVDEVTKHFAPIRIKSLNFLIETRNKRIVYFKLNNNKTLRKLNQEVVKNSYKLRTGTMPWAYQNPPKKWEQGNREKYGTQHNIGKSFHPHFTMAYLKNHEDAMKVSREMKSIKFKFLADTIAITEVNFWHQVTRIIEKFKLK